MDEIEAFQSYEVEDCEAQYLSWETIEEIERCERGNLIMNGMTYDELFEYYDGDLDFTYVNGSLVQTSTLPKEDPINWKNFFIKLGVGVGVILIATTVTVVTGGTAAPVMCFLATTAKLGAMAVVGGAVGATVEYAVTGDENAALQGFADGFGFTALMASTAAAGGVIPSLCFPAGTPVHTLNGILPIENIKVGDSVLSYNEATGKQEYQKVLRLFPNATEELISIDIDGETIEATPRHPFYLKNLGWVRANELKPGDSVLMKDGSGGIVRSVEKIDKAVPVYNFEVEKNHDYYVGKKGFLVHNIGCGAAIGSELSGSSSSSGIMEGLAIGGSAVAGAASGAISAKRSITLTQSYERKKAKVQEKVKELERTMPEGDTVILKWDTKTYAHLTPRPIKDEETGLSFEIFTIDRLDFYISKRCLIFTTMNTVNNTIQLKAIQDGVKHVSIKPTNPAILQEWIASHDNANIRPHELTVILYSIVEELRI